jgi:hypothetical protein
VHLYPAVADKIDDPPFATRVATKQCSYFYVQLQQKYNFKSSFDDKIYDPQVAIRVATKH